MSILPSTDKNGYQHKGIAKGAAGLIKDLFTNNPQYSLTQKGIDLGIKQEQIALIKQFAQEYDNASDKASVLSNTIEHCSEQTQDFVQSGISAKKSASAMAGELIQVNAKAKLAAVGWNILNAAMTAGISIAISVLLPKLINYLDGVINKTRELQDSVDKTKDKIDSIQSDIKELESIDHRNTDEQNRLDNLREELEVQERILQIEEKRALNSKYRDDITSNFDKDAYNNQYLKDIFDQQQILTKGLGRNQYDALTDKINKKESKLQERKDWYNENADRWLTDEGKQKRLLKDQELADELEEIKAKRDDILIDIYAQATEYKAKIAEIDADIQNADENGMSQSSIKQAEELKEKYQNLLDGLDPYLEKWEERQKELGTFDYSKEIESVFQHAEFDGLKDTLLDLAKNDELSPSILTNKYEELAEAMKAAGVDADALYKYLLRLSGKVDTSNLASNIVGQLGDKSTGEFDNRGFERNAESVLQAYLDTLDPEQLDIVTNLDVDWSTFDVYQVIDKMQAEIDKAGAVKVQVETEFDQSKFSEQVNVLDALQSSYTNFINNVNNKEAKINLDISEVDALREKFGELEKFDETFDFDKFERILTSDTILDNSYATKAEEMQAAFDSALTAYANYKIELKGINEENKEMIRTQIEMEGATAESAKTFVDYHEEIAKGKRLHEETRNMTLAEAKAFLVEAQASDVARIAMFQAAAAEQVFNNDKLDVTGKVAQLKQLATAYLGVAQSADIAAQADAWLDDYKNGRGGLTAADVEQALSGLTSNIQIPAPELNFDPTIIGAKEAGGKAGDEFKNAFEERVSKMNAAISAVGTLMGKKISAAQSSKDAAIKSLNSQKDAAVAAIKAEQKARVDAINAEIKAIDNQIKAYEKQQKVLQDQIKAIEDANAARERQLNLQKAIQQLYQAENQRTRLVA